MALTQDSRNRYQENINSYKQGLSDAQNNSQSTYNTYNQYKQQADNKYNSYQNEIANQKDYTNIYNNAGNNLMSDPNYANMDNSRKAYQNARDNVNRTNSQINALPDSINSTMAQRGVFNSGARDAAVNYQGKQLQNALNNYNTSYSNAYQDYNDTYNRYLNEKQNIASNELAQQESNLGRSQADWNTLFNHQDSMYSTYQDALAKVLAARQLVGSGNDAYSTGEEQANEYDRTLAEQKRQFNAEQAQYKNYLASLAKDNESQRYSIDTTGKRGEGYQFYDTKTGLPVKASTYFQQQADSSGKSFNDVAKQYLQIMANNGDYNAQQALQGSNGTGAEFINGLNAGGGDHFNILGLGLGSY